jgi:hypothetical protein
MKNLLKALAEFQQEVPVIHKGTQGYGYSYSDLPEIFRVINPLLKKHGLGFSQPIMGDCVKTILFHVESGELLESLTEIPKGVQLKGMNDFQVLGSAISYLRRYALSSILGIISDKDTDASGQQTSAPKAQTKEKQTLTPERFDNALKAVEDGKLSKQDLLVKMSEFQLTTTQKINIKNFCDGEA